MHFQTLTIKNFRQFKDTKISFDDNFNSLIGTNGDGKSTIRIAILLCLYGTNFIYDHDLFDDFGKKQNSNQHDLSCLFSKDVDYGKNDINIVTEIKLDDNSYIELNRTIRMNRLFRFDDIIEVIIKNYSNNFKAEPMEYNDFLKIFPKNFSVFSFIAGERINSITDILNASSGNLGIKDDIENMFELNKLKDAEKIISSACKIMHESIKGNTEEQEKIDELNQKVTDSYTSIDEINSDLEIKEKQLTDYNALYIKQKNEIISMESASKLSDQKDKYEVEIVNYKANLETIIATTNTSSQSNLTKNLLSNFLGKIDFDEENIRSIIPGLSQEAIEYISSNSNCICGNIHTPNTLENLQVLKKNQPPKNLIEILSTLSKQYDDETFEHKELLEDNTKLIFEINEKIELLEAKLSDTNKKITAEIGAKLLDKDRLVNLAISNTEIKNKIRSIEAHKLDSIRRINSFESDIKVAEKVLDKFMKKNSSTEDLEICFDLENTRDYLQNLINEIEFNIKEELTNDVNYFANKLLTKKVSINIKKNYIPEAKILDGISGLSDGEKSIISLSYLFGLMKTVKNLTSKYGDVTTCYTESFPIILDAIYAPLGETLISNVTKEINEYTGQVIMFNNEAHFASIVGDLKVERKNFQLIMEDTNISVTKVMEV